MLRITIIAYFYNLSTIRELFQIFTIFFNFLILLILRHHQVRINLIEHILHYSYDDDNS
jgi:hypothetical protein